MRTRFIPAFAASMALAAGAPLAAQSYQGAGGSTAADETSGDDAGEAGSGRGSRRLVIAPYVEVSQIGVWEFAPGNDAVTYTQLAAGVDATLAGRNNGATVSLRYERNIGYGDASDSDTLTGVARGYATIIPQALTMEAGALAARTRVDDNGTNVFNPLSGNDDSTETYSAYIGPNLNMRAGDVQVQGSYRLGYTRVDSPDVVPGAGLANVEIFDESVTHDAQLRAGTQPGEPLPVGVGVGAGYFQEDVNNLDQRVVDSYARGDVTIPVSPTLAVVGGIGYEDVEVSGRDALRDGAGNPIVGSDGRFVTDSASPRRIAFEADGIIWDVGVVWRPSSRTQLQASFGRRYDSDTFYGSFAWQPDRRSSVGIAVYDRISGFGGRLTNSLAGLPTDFDVIRDPVSGDIIGCVNTVDGSSCLDGILGSARSSIFRSRGVTASYSRRVGNMTAAIGAGYDRRNFFAAPGTVLAAANGVIDESYYITGSVGGATSSRGTFTVTTYANWFESGNAVDGDVFALGSSAAYNHQLTRGLSARAAVALNYLDNELTAEDFKTASALVGLRYDF